MILDTPCAAGARTTDFVRVLQNNSAERVWHVTTSVRNSNSKESVSGHGIGTKSRALFFSVLPKKFQMSVRKVVPEPAVTSS